MWVIPPEQNGAFVAHMEAILDLYQQPYEPQVPLVCKHGQSTLYTSAEIIDCTRHTLSR